VFVAEDALFNHTSTGLVGKWHRIARECLAQAPFLSERERRFVKGMAERAENNAAPSEKQQTWLLKVHAGI
jgi:hypothetical protein